MKNQTGPGQHERKGGSQLESGVSEAEKLSWVGCLGALSGVFGSRGGGA